MYFYSMTIFTHLKLFFQVELIFVKLIKVLIAEEDEAKRIIENFTNPSGDHADVFNISINYSKVSSFSVLCSINECNTKSVANLRTKNVLYSTYYQLFIQK